MEENTDKSFQFRDKTIFSNDRSELLTLVKNVLIQAKSPFLIFTPNPEQLVLAETDESFNLELKKADLLLPDGVGLMWASNFLSNENNPPIKERLPGRLIVEDLLNLAKEQKLSTLVIGGRDYANEESFLINGQKIYWTAGYLDVNNPTEGEEVEISKLIEKIKPDFVFVAFGAPQQEHWLLTHLPLMKANHVGVGMAVGGTFDYLLGKVPTPPIWVSKMGLEWLFRLITQPHRFGRQLKLFNFVGLVLEEKWQNT
jgi:N-acetylglucosaminyldiphosphoundecaprenol N-acetyl-beta-D-mannosaminyltransferase